MRRYSKPPAPTPKKTEERAAAIAKNRERALKLLEAIEKSMR